MTWPWELCWCAIEMQAVISEHGLQYDGCSEWFFESSTIFNLGNLEVELAILIGRNRLHGSLMFSGTRQAVRSVTLLSIPFISKFLMRCARQCISAVQISVTFYIIKTNSMQCFSTNKNMKYMPTQAGARGKRKGCATRAWERGRRQTARTTSSWTKSWGKKSN